MDCNCSASSLAASAKYAGFMPFVLPVYATLPYCNLCKHACASVDLVQGWLLISRPAERRLDPWDPPPSPPPPPMAYGGWYHFPAGAKCPDDGTPVGTNGCTWRRDPRACAPLFPRPARQSPEVVWAAVARHMLYGPGLLAAGWNNSDSSPTPNSRIEGNAAAARKAMDALTTRCCGC